MYTKHLSSRTPISRLFFGSALLSAAVVSTLFLQGCEGKLTDKEFVERAKKAEQLGEFNSAIIDAKSALQINPNSTDARLLLVNSYLRLGDGVSAEKEARRLLELGVPTKTISIPLAEALLMQGKPGIALDEINKIKDAPAELEAEVALIRGKAFLQLDNRAAASEALQSVFSLADDSSVAWKARALLAYMRGNWDESKSYLDLVLQQHPGDAETLALKGEVAVVTEDYTAAIAAFEEATRSQPFNLPYKLSLAQLYMWTDNLEAGARLLDQLLEAAPNHAEANYLRAVCAFEKQSWALALQHSEKVLASYPEHIKSIYIAGAASDALGQYEVANSRLLRVAAKWPGNDTVKRQLAETQLHLDQASDAAETALSITTPSENDVRLFTRIGTALLAEQRQDTAQKLLQKAASLSPGDELAHTALGYTYLIDQKTEDGLRTFEEATNEESGSSSPQIGVILTLLQAGRYPEALTAALELQESEPQKPEGFTLAGMAYGSMGESDNAKAEFEKALQLSPYDVNASINLSAYLLQDGEYDNARRLLESSLDDNPGNASVLFRLADLELKAGRRSVAIVRLEEAIDADSTKKSARVTLATLYFQTNRFQDAIRVAQATEDYEEDLTLLEVIGRSQLNLSRFGDAIKHLKDWSELEPRNAAPHYYLALAYYRQGSNKQALREVDAALAIDPENTLVKFIGARVSAHSGQIDRAKSQLEELMKENPRNPLLSELQGEIALMENRPKDAAAAFKSALGEKQNNYLIIKLATAQLAEKDADAAYETLESWLQKYPEDPLSREFFASQLLAAQKLPEAKQQYETLVSYQPNNAMALNNLSWILLQLGQKDEALVQARKALNLAPENSYVLDTLAQITMELGEREEALQLFRQAVEASPDNYTAQLHLAQVLADNNERAEAQEILTALASSKADSETKEQAENLLQELH